VMQSLPWKVIMLPGAGEMRQHKQEQKPDPRPLESSPGRGGGVGFGAEASEVQCCVWALS